MQIKVFNGKSEQPTEEETIFYIQNKGYKAGRPLKKPIPNCWEIRTRRSVDFEILSILYESKILSVFIIGSVIPFLRLCDYKKIIVPILEKAIHDNRIINAHYLQIRKIEENIMHQEKIKKLLHDMKITLSKEVCRKLAIEI